MLSIYLLVNLLYVSAATSTTNLVALTRALLRARESSAGDGSRRLRGGMLTRVAVVGCRPGGQDGAVDVWPSTLSFPSPKLCKVHHTDCHSK